MEIIAICVLAGWCAGLTWWGLGVRHDLKNEIESVCSVLNKRLLRAEDQMDLRMDDKCLDINNRIAKTKMETLEEMASVIGPMKRDVEESYSFIKNSMQEFRRDWLGTLRSRNAEIDDLKEDVAELRKQHGTPR